MDSHFGLAPSALRHANVQEATTEFQKALTANGYLRARAIRMKLLHLHIAAITGVHRLTHHCDLKIDAPSPVDCLMIDPVAALANFQIQAPRLLCCISLGVNFYTKTGAALTLPSGLVGNGGRTPEELLGSDKDMEILNRAGLWKQSYWYRLKQRMQPPTMQCKDPYRSIV
jgi:hypothetical protein